MSGIQIDQHRLSDAFHRVMALPVAKYVTPETLKVDPDKTILVSMDGTGVTNSRSDTPIIGTRAFNPCMALILYNKRTKTAGIMHEPFLAPEHFFALMSKVRTDEKDPVHAHLMGQPIYAEHEHDAEDMNKMSLSALNRLAEAFESEPNLIVKTFDVYSKPKPSAVAIDTRNGRLIRGSDLYVKSFQDLYNTTDFFYEWPYLQRGEHFDNPAQPAPGPY